MKVFFRGFMNRSELVDSFKFPRTEFKPKIVPTKDPLDQICGVPGVRKAYYTYGRFDIAAFLVVEDYKSIRIITGKMNSFEGVRSTETLAEA